MRQDAGRSDVGDGQTGLGDTGGNQSGLSLTQTGEQVGELREPTWNNNRRQHEISGVFVPFVFDGMSTFCLQPQKLN